MAKGQKRSNREPKKPKQDKTKKAVVARSAFASLGVGPTPPSPTKKK